MADQSEAQLVEDIARRQDLPKDAVETVLKALKSGNGSMAQFSHPAFGGMSQWSPGMTMVGDMFNNGLKTKLDAVASELSDFVRKNPATKDSGDRAKASDDVSYRSNNSASRSDWWPKHLGSPNSIGAQNDMRYAIFNDAHRLAIEDGGKVKLFDTGSHRISGAGQAQGGGSTLTFTSQDGLVRVDDLKTVDR